MTEPAKIPRFPAAALAALLVLAACTAAAPLRAAQNIVVVKGEAGDANYLAEIDATAQLWIGTAKKGGHSVQIIEPGEAGASQLERLRAHLSKVKSPSKEPLWIVLIGHGSAQGKAAKFLLNGPDLTAGDLSSMLSRVERPAILVAGFACSGAFITPIAGPDRVLVSATRSGREDNWVRFPRLFAEAISSLDADMDADGEVSVFEAWLHASRAVVSYYRQDGRMLTEHAVLSEPGAERPLEYRLFETQPKEPPKVVVPTEVAPLASRWPLAASPFEAALSPEGRALRQVLETELEALRKSKARLAPREYRTLLESLLLRLAALHAAVRER